LNTIGTINESSATEMSMLKMMDKFGVDIQQLRDYHLGTNEDFVRFHFTSKRKRMSTIMQNCGPTMHNYDRRCHIKGASELVLGNCTHYLNQEGQRIELQDEIKSHLKQIITDYAAGALRTISFGYKDLKPTDGG
jgi:Ca2+-transporting ATPase